MQNSPHIVQVSFHLDSAQRTPQELLSEWPTLVSVAAAVAQKGAKVSVVQACHYDEIIQHEGVDYYFVSDSRRRRPSKALSPLRRAEQIETRVGLLLPDIVHIHGLNAPVKTRYLAETLPTTPLLVQDHASRPPEGWRRRVHRWGLRRLAGAAFTAREQAEPFVKAGVFPADLPIFEVVEGSTTFTPGDQQAAQTNSGLHGDPCLLWVGRLDQNKDPHTVLDAVALALNQLPGLHLWCCYTEESLETSVRSRIAQDPALGQRVHLLGAVPHPKMQDLYRAADFLVSGSHSEGSGYSVIEALACGATPLITDIPSFRRIAGNGAAGALSPLDDHEAMARAIVEWSRRDRGRLRQAARGHFEESLSYPAIGDQLCAAYGELLKAR